MTDLISELDKVKWNNIQNSFVVFDVETTGLDSRADRILEIGAVLFEKDEYFKTGELKTFQCFVKQKKPIPIEATAINKITDEMVKNGEEEYRALELFFDFVGSNDLYAYNAKFDKSFMNAMAKRSRFAHEPVIENIFDIYKYIKDEYEIKPNYKLTTVAKHLKIDTSDAHRAVGDSVLALKSYIHVVQTLNMLRRKMEIEHEDWCKKNLSMYKKNNNNIKDPIKEESKEAPPPQNDSAFEKYTTKILTTLIGFVFILFPIYLMLKI